MPATKYKTNQMQGGKSWHTDSVYSSGARSRGVTKDGRCCCHRACVSGSGWWCGCAVACALSSRNERYTSKLLTFHTDENLQQRQTGDRSHQDFTDFGLNFASFSQICDICYRIFDGQISLRPLQIRRNIFFAEKTYQVQSGNKAKGGAPIRRVQN